MALSKLLYAADIAELLGTSVRQARRQLIDWEARYGVMVVGRMPGRTGPQRYTTLAGIEAIGPKLSQRIAALDDKLTELGDQVCALERRLESLESTRARKAS